MTGLLKGLGRHGIKHLGQRPVKRRETVSTRTRRNDLAAALARCHRAARRELHRVHAVLAQCPDWCIYIEGHKELGPPRRRRRQAAQVQRLDRFDIDFALCMYCGICVEVCPFDALFWSPEYEYSEPQIADLSTTRPSSVSGWRPCPKPPSSKQEPVSR